MTQIHIFTPASGRNSLMVSRLHTHNRHAARTGRPEWFLPTYLCYFDRPMRKTEGDVSCRSNFVRMADNDHAFVQ